MIRNVPKVQSVPGLQELGGQVAGAARGRGCVVRVEASEGGTPQKEALKEEAGEWADPICLFKGTLDPAEDGVERGPIDAFHFISCRKTSLGVQNHPARGDNSREVEGGQWVQATCWGWAQLRGMMIKMWGLEEGEGGGITEWFPGSWPKVWGRRRCCAQRKKAGRKDSTRRS